MSDPYEVLGLPPTASFAEVRARYFQLAKKHHPDKLPHLSEQEKKENEEYFQKVSVAYSQIEQQSPTQSPSRDEEEGGTQHWRHIWAKVETMFQRPDVWECMRQVFKDTITDVVMKAKEGKRTHHIKVPVTLAELHRKKRKKLQVFLQSVKEPIHTFLDCGEYPNPRTFTTCINEEDHTVRIDFDVQEHPLFRIDDVLGTPDLYVDVDMTWYDYIYGKTVSVVLLNDEPWDLVIEPFVDLRYPKRYAGMGVAGKGDMYVNLVLRHPSHQQWSRVEPASQQVFGEILNALFRMSSGLP